MAKKQIFERNQTNDYLAQLEELLKKNKGSGLYEAYDVNPRAYKLSEDQIVDPSGLGQDKINDSVKYAQYSPTSIAMNAPKLSQVGQYDFQTPEQAPQEQAPQEQAPQEQAPQEEFNPSTAQGFAQIMSEMVAVPVAQTQDGGTLLSSGFVQYSDGTTRKATQADIPGVVRQFSDGSVLLENGQFLNPSNSIGRGYKGTTGLSDLVFGQQQTITQDYGNVNPIEPTAGNINYGTDFRTRDLPENFNFTLPFEAKVVEITTDDGTQFGTTSGHKGYGNSVMLQLPNGTMIRMAHLSDMENFHVGDNVKAFDYIGTPGQTGNAYGEHLDLEYYGQDGNIADPQTFLLDSMDYISREAINQSSQGDSSRLQPEERQWLETQQQTINNGQQMSVEPNAMQNQTQPQPQQPVAEMGQNVKQAIQPMSPQRQELGSQVNQLGQNLGLPKEGFVGAGEAVAGDLPAAGRELSSTIERADLTPRIDTGLSELLRGDKEGARENFQDTLARAKARLQRVPGEIKEAVTPQVQAGDGEAQQPKETLGQNIRGAAESAGNYALAKAGDGIAALKQTARNYFQKAPLMGMNEGQNQVGQAKGESVLQSTGTQTKAPEADAFFNYGGAEQYADKLIDNAKEAEGGALNTSLFKSDFFKNPNDVANVFGQTSQGKEATGLYKNYLNEQIKPGFDEPYRTERRDEGGDIYEYKIPVEEYWKNKYYNDLIGETPDVLENGFGYDKFQMPTQTKTASDFKGEAPIRDSSSPIFKSDAVNLFSKSAMQPGQLAKQLFKTPAAVYQPSQQSRSFALPEQTKTNMFKMPDVSSLKMPQTVRNLISRKKESSGGSSGSNNSGGSNNFSMPNVPAQNQSVAARYSSNKAQEQKQGGVKLSSGKVATVSPERHKTSSAELSSSNNKSIFAGAASWLKNLFRRR